MFIFGVLYLLNTISQILQKKSILSKLHILTYCSGNSSLTGAPFRNVSYETKLSSMYVSYDRIVMSSSSDVSEPPTRVRVDDSDESSSSDELSDDSSESYTVIPLLNLKALWSDIHDLRS